MSIKAFVRNTLPKFISFVIPYQPLWELLFKVSLKLMNFGNGGNFKESGELFAARKIRSHLQNYSTLHIFDVGANIGMYARSLAKIFGDDASIYSFEPSKITYDTLRKTVKEIKTITPFNIGFSDTDRSETLYFDSKESSLGSLYKRKLDHFGIDMNLTEKVELTTIDNFCTTQNIELIHFLKLDIEGHELNALKGAAKMLEKGKILFIQFEFGGCNIDSRTYFQDIFYFLESRYKIYRILPNSVREIKKYSETLEVFVTVNYLAVKKESDIANF